MTSRRQEAGVTGEQWSVSDLLNAMTEGAGIGLQSSDDTQGFGSFSGRQPIEGSIVTDWEAAFRPTPASLSALAARSPESPSPAAPIGSDIEPYDYGRSHGGLVGQDSYDEAKMAQIAAILEGRTPASQRMTLEQRVAYVGNMTGLSQAVKRGVVYAVRKRYGVNVQLNPQAEPDYAPGAFTRGEGYGTTAKVGSVALTGSRASESNSTSTDWQSYSSGSESRKPRKKDGSFKQWRGEHPTMWLGMKFAGTIATGALLIPGGVQATIDQFPPLAVPKLVVDRDHAYIVDHTPEPARTVLKWMRIL